MIQWASARASQSVSQPVSQSVKEGHAKVKTWDLSVRLCMCVCVCTCLNKDIYKKLHMISLSTIEPCLDTDIWDWLPGTRNIKQYSNIL